MDSGGIQRRGVAGAGMHALIKAGCGGERRSTIHNNNRDPHSSLPLLAAPSRASGPPPNKSALPGVAGESPVGLRWCMQGEAAGGRMVDCASGCE